MYNTTTGIIRQAKIQIVCIEGSHTLCYDISVDRTALGLPSSSVIVICLYTEIGRAELLKMLRKQSVEIRKYVVCYISYESMGPTENARPDIVRPSKLWGLTSRDWTTRHHIARVDIARLVSVFE